MASAGIRKSPTGRYMVWWRLADVSQGSQTFATRDQARDVKHDLLARLAHGSSVDPQLGRQTFETLARECGKAGPPIPTTAHGHSKPQRRACGGTCVGSGYQTTGRRGWLPRRLLGRGKRGGSPGRNDIPERSLHDEWAGDDCEGREDMEKLLLTPEEAAAALGICRSKLYELLQAGVIESVHIGTSRRIPVAAMVEYVERLRQEATA